MSNRFDRSALCLSNKIRTGQSSMPVIVYLSHAFNCTDLCCNDRLRAAFGKLYII